MAGAGAGADQGPPAAGKAGVLAPGDQGWRDWAGLPEHVLVKVAGKVVAQNGAAWAAYYKGVLGWGEKELQELLVKVAGTLVAQTEAALAAQWKREGGSEAEIHETMENRKRLGPSRGLFVFARVCKPWRKAQLKVGGPLRTRVRSDVIMPGSVALVKWALAEGCPTMAEDRTNMAEAAVQHVHLELAKWLHGEKGVPLDFLWRFCWRGEVSLEAAVETARRGCNC